MLKLSGVKAAYGTIAALHDVTIEVSEGQIVTLLGANGAGKSSTLRVASGLLRPTGGTVEYLGRHIERATPESLVALGIAHVPEGRQLFTELTVRENLTLGAYTRRDHDRVKEDIDRMSQYFPILEQRREQTAGSLSGGEQQMLAIARGLMSRPKLLLLDEPSLGLAPLVVQEIFRILKMVNQEDSVTILLVEQNATLALSIADYGYVLETGRIVLEDKAERLRGSEEMRRSYLG